MSCIAEIANDIAKRCHDLVENGCGNDNDERLYRVMPKYVNADKIIEHLNDEIEGCGDCDVYSQPVVYGTRLGLEYSKSLVETAETADVVRIVRCKDCIHRDPEDKKCDCSFQAKGGIFPMDDDDFCSYGEKKKEDVDA